MLGRSLLIIASAGMARNESLERAETEGISDVYRPITGAASITVRFQTINALYQ
jgi:hypothetical protein